MTLDQGCFLKKGDGVGKVTSAKFMAPESKRLDSAFSSPCHFFSAR